MAAPLVALGSLIVGAAGRFGVKQAAKSMAKRHYAPVSDKLTTMAREGFLRQSPEAIRKVTADVRANTAKINQLNDAIRRRYGLPTK